MRVVATRGALGGASSRSKPAKETYQNLLIRSPFSNFRGHQDGSPELSDNRPGRNSRSLCGEASQEQSIELIRGETDHHHRVDLVVR